MEEWEVEWGFTKKLTFVAFSHKFFWLCLNSFNAHKWAGYRRSLNSRKTTILKKEEIEVKSLNVTSLYKLPFIFFRFPFGLLVIFQIFYRFIIGSIVSV